jgi:hypothetical protein
MRFQNTFFLHHASSITAQSTPSYFTYGSTMIYSLHSPQTAPKTLCSSGRGTLHTAASHALPHTFLEGAIDRALHLQAHCAALLSPRTVVYRIKLETAIACVAHSLP